MMTTEMSSERVHAVQQLLADEIVNNTMDGIERLPSLPRTYTQLSQALANPEVNISDIANIVEADPAMCVKVLQLVNSAFFGMSQSITSVTKAVNLLGTELLKSLILQAHIICAVEDRMPREFSLSRFQMYSIKVARLAKRFVVSADHADEAFTCGMVHDIGKLVLALKAPLQFDSFLKRSSESTDPLYDIEREILGTSHAEAGAWLLSSWGIPLPIVECVAFHHNPSAVGSGDREVLAVVHAADALMGILGCGDPENRLDSDFIASAGLSREIPRWRALVEQELGNQ
jgi:HD-like signal output (HDOD) protein